MRVLLSMMLAFALTSIAAAGAQLTEENGLIRITLDGKPFTEYRLKADDGGPLARPFLYPVLASDGTPVTADQTALEGDHRHHRSLWIGHGDVNGADHWEKAAAGEGVPLQRPVGPVTIEADALTHELDWDGPDGKPALRETRTLRFFSFPDGNRGVDVTSLYRAVAGQVTFGDTKEAGLCAVRVAPAISANPKVTNSRMMRGEGACWGWPAAWCDIAGKIGSKPYGVAILDHPSNPRHPSRWHVRRYGLMGANIFGLKHFLEGKAEESGELVLEPGRVLAFKYRVVVHTGDATRAGLDEKFNSFAGESGPGLVPIFNGRDFTGWKLPDPNPWWKVVDGAIVGANDPKKRGHELETEREYRDLILEADFKFAGEIDSGIFLRKNRRLQVQIGVSRSLKRDMTCSIYSRGYPGQAKGVAEVLKVGKWNRMRVLAIGPRIRIWLNGRRVLDYVDLRFRDAGPVALQIHGGVEMKVEFRNLRIRDLSKETVEELPS